MNSLARLGVAFALLFAVLPLASRAAAAEENNSNSKPTIKVAAGAGAKTATVLPGAALAGANGSSVYPMPYGSVIYYTYACCPDETHFYIFDESVPYVSNGDDDGIGTITQTGASVDAKVTATTRSDPPGHYVGTIVTDPNTGTSTATGTWSSVQNGHSSDGKWRSVYGRPYPVLATSNTAGAIDSKTKQLTFTLQGYPADKITSFTVTQPHFGTITPTTSSSGVFTYTQTAPFTSDADNFSYTVSDGVVNSAPQVNVTVTNGDNGLSATGQAVTVPPMDSVTIQLAGLPANRVNQYYFKSQSNPNYGTLDTTQLSSGIVKYTQTTDIGGTFDSFTFTVGDGNVVSRDPATVTITQGTAPKPVGIPQTVTADSTGKAIIHLHSANLVAGRTPYYILGDASFGTLSSSGVGGETVTYQLTGNASGSDSFIFNVTDGSPRSDPATVTVNFGKFPFATIVATKPDAVIGPPAIPGEFTVSLDTAQPSDTIVGYTVSGSAAAGTDYNTLPGTVTVAAGQTAATIPVTPGSNAAFSGKHSVLVSLKAGTGYAVGAPGSATVNVSSSITASITATVPNAAEGVPPIPGEFTVTLDSAPATDLDIRYLVGDTAQPGTDYTALPGKITVPAGQTSAKIPVIPGKMSFTTPRSVDVSLLSSPGYALGTARHAAVTISSTLPTATISASIKTAKEGNPPTPGEFTVSLNLVSYADIDITLSASGTAVPGTDYVAVPGKVTIGAGISAVTFAVTPFNTRFMDTRNVIVAVVGGSSFYIPGTPNFAAVSINSLPTLPLTVGVLTVNGDTIEDLGSNLYRVSSGNVVSINSNMAIDQPVICDLTKLQIMFSGNLSVVSSGKTTAFGAAASTIIDGTTGKITNSATLGAKFNIGGIAIQFSNVTFFGPGITFDFNLNVPGVAKSGDSADPKDTVQVEIKGARVDNVSPYIHFEAVKFEVNDVFLFKSQYKLKHFLVSYNTVTETFDGDVTLEFPSGKSVGGSIQFIHGTLNQISFMVGGLHEIIFPDPTGTGGIYLTSLGGGVNHLADVKPLELDLTSLGLTWGLGGADLVNFEGMGSFNTKFDVSASGTVTILPAYSNGAFKVGSAGFLYSPSTSKLLQVNGTLQIFDYVKLGTVMVNSFGNPSYITAAASGNIGFPPVGLGKFVKVSLKGDAAVYISSAGTGLAGIQAAVNVPPFGPFTLRYQYNMITNEGEWVDTLDSSLLATISKDGVKSLRAAQSSALNITSGLGGDGVIVRLKYQTGGVDFNIRRPDNSLLTPKSADDINVAYLQNPDGHESTYLLKSLADGAYTVEFDDAGIGNWTVNIFTKPVAPTLIVQPEQDTTIAAGTPLTINYTTQNMSANSTVRAFLSPTQVWGNGTVVASAPSTETKALLADLSNIAPGDYYVCVDCNPPGSLPIHAFAPGRVFIRAAGAPLIGGALYARALAGKSFAYNLAITGGTPDTVSATGLPDGLALTGAAIGGVPTAGGKSPVQLRAGNASGTDSKTLLLSVAKDALDYETLNSNGDGVPDELKLLLGLNPADSNPVPVDPASVQTISKTKLQLKLSAKPNSDSVTLSAELPVEFSAADGKDFAISVGGVIRHFTLDKSGTSKTATESCKLTLAKAGKVKGTKPSKKSTPKSASSTFSMKLSKASLTAQLAILDLGFDADAKGLRNIVLYASFDGALFSAVQQLNLTAKKGVGSSAQSK